MPYSTVFLLAVFSLSTYLSQFGEVAVSVNQRARACDTSVMAQTDTKLWDDAGLRDARRWTCAAEHPHLVGATPGGAVIVSYYPVVGHGTVYAGYV
jgi:hypothetical protein